MVIMLVVTVLSAYNYTVFVLNILKYHNDIVKLSFIETQTF